MVLDKPAISCLEEGDGHKATFTLEPLERGYGLTLGNALRRVLLGNLEGVAPISIKIEGVDHEFQTVKGVVEDVTDIILNLKDLAVKSIDDSADFRGTLRINKTSEGAIYASDIEASSDIIVCNPDMYICTLDGKIPFVAEITVARGRGYVVASEHKNLPEAIGNIAMDASFSPVVKASYVVENARVGQRIDFDKLILEVETNASVSAKEVVALASKLLQDHTQLFVEQVEYMSGLNTLESKEEDGQAKLLELNIEDLKLSQRSHNCLIRAGIVTVDDLCKRSKEDMLKVRNLGQKSYEEIMQKIESLGLSLRKEEE